MGVWMMHRSTDRADGPQFKSRLRRTIGHPRFFMVTIAIAFGLITYTTFRQPPHYLRHPYWWATLVGIAAIACGLAAWRATRASVSVGGTAVITAALIRGLANIFSIADATSPQDRTTLTVAGILWLGFSHLAYITWIHVLLPWAVRTRKTPDAGGS